jgi:tRNA dimethylallyltransferase
MAVELAELFDGELVGRAASQVYRGLDIVQLSRQPNNSRVPHHLLDVVAPDELFTLSHYLSLSRRAIGDIASRRRAPFVVGGTGQYLWALLRGNQPPAVAPDPSLRQSLDAVAQAGGPSALRS